MRETRPGGPPSSEADVDRHERRFREEQAHRREWREEARERAGRAEDALSPAQPPGGAGDRGRGHSGERHGERRAEGTGPTEVIARERRPASSEPSFESASLERESELPSGATGFGALATRAGELPIGEERASVPPLSRRSPLAGLHLRLGLLAFLSFLTFGFAVLPRAIGDWLERGELPQAHLTRDRIGHRLISLRDRFLLLADDVEEQRRRVEKIRIAYGLAVSMEPLPATVVDPKAFPASMFRPAIEETAMLATMARIEVVDLEAKVAALRAFEAARPEVVAFAPALSPLEGEFVVTSLFGYRKSAFTDAQEYHAGVDLAAAVGTPVLAPADGTVVFVGRFPVMRESTWWRLGQVVALRHGDELLTIYGQCDRIRVRRGQTVARGDVLAQIGESGVSANPHLHYAVWRRRPTYDARDRPHGDFEPMDPRLLMLDRQWDDEEELLANAAARPARSVYEPLPRQLRRELVR